MTDAEKIAALVELLGLSQDEARAMLVDAGELADPDELEMAVTIDETFTCPLCKSRSAYRAGADRASLSCPTCGHKAAAEAVDPEDPRMYDVTTNWPLPEPLEGGDR